MLRVEAQHSDAQQCVSSSFCLLPMWLHRRFPDITREQALIIRGGSFGSETHPPQKKKTWPKIWLRENQV